MAVPDWPTTYGYNLFLYPLSTWLAGPWDLFIEHGHRLLGAAVGVITIAMLCAVWVCDRRVWLRWLAIAALALVVFQGLLGGLRVLQNSRQIAQVHGVVGPAFFSLSMLLVAATSRWWQRRERISGLSDYAVSAWMLVGLAFVQLLLGSQLRHVSSFTSLGTFSACVTFHVTLAVVLLVIGAATSWSAWRGLCAAPALRRWAVLIGPLIGLQILLGVGTWTAKYGWPSIATRFGLEANVVVRVESMLQSMTITGHVALGALILGVAVAWAARVGRLSLAPQGAANWLKSGKSSRMAEGVR